MSRPHAFRALVTTARTAWTILQGNIRGCAISHLIYLQTSEACWYSMQNVVLLAACGTAYFGRTETYSCWVQLRSQRGHSAPMPLRSHHE
jgi:hypothetical protein